MHTYFMWIRGHSAAPRKDILHVFCREVEVGVDLAEYRVGHALGL